MNLFYTPNISSELYSLNEEESKHCAKVLRLTHGDIIYLIDGKGGFYEAEILEILPKRCSIKVISLKKNYGKKNFFLHLAVAPTKNIERFEWFLEKASEMGVDEISPIHCQRSERTIIKTERLNKIITSAIKQSIKAYHPRLNEMLSFTKFITDFREFNGRKYIAHCLSAQSMELGVRVGFSCLFEEQDKVGVRVYNKGENALILIGPEGDFSEEEIKMAVKNGFQPITLGNSRLRTETAAIAACHTINFLNQ